MVITQLFGGLGNQLFQYAAGRALALRHNVPLGLDVSRFVHNHSRAYSLHPFAIQAQVLPPLAISWMTAPERLRPLTRVYCRIRFGSLRQMRRLDEAHFHYDPRIESAGDHTYLTGFWQSERYFCDCAEIVRNELQVRSAPDPVNRELAQRIAETESVSLHVRRGDMVYNPESYRRHGVCSLEYYEAGTAWIAQRTTHPHFYVFSDDMEWVRANLRIEYPVTYVEHNGAARDYEDLRLMSGCRHHIIANSTFSWWGAWLSTAKEKLVVAPARWFNELEYDTRDLIPASWVRL